MGAATVVVPAFIDIPAGLSIFGKLVTYCATTFLFAIDDEALVRATMIVFARLQFDASSIVVSHSIVFRTMTAVTTLMIFTIIRALVQTQGTLVNVAASAPVFVELVPIRTSTRETARCIDTFVRTVV